MLRRCTAFAVVMSVGFVAQAKSGPDLHSREEVDRARALCDAEPWAADLRAKAIEAAEPWLQMTDEEIWTFIPEAEQPRALNVNFGVGCPICGKEIFREGGHYPWDMDREHPFKVVCPVCKTSFPSNDFAAYTEGGRTEKLDVTEPYVDDGFGYVAPDGQRYFFVAHYLFWQRWRRDVMGMLEALGAAYELTGRPEYAHRAGVALGRLREVYPRMDYATQAYHNGEWPAGINGRILDYVWENRTIQTISRAYDRIYPALGGNEELKRFLAARGISELRTEFEREVLAFMARDIMEGRIRGNMYYQPTLAHLAIVMDNHDPAIGPTTDEMADWLLRGGGELETILYNGFDRDGIGGESAPGYSLTWNENFCNLAELLVKLGVDVTADPRWRNLIRYPQNLLVAGRYTPRIGDCGGTIHTPGTLVSPRVLSFGFRHFQDPECAQWLIMRGGPFGNSLWNETLDRAEVEAVAQAHPDLTDRRTRDLGGYGLTIFDSGGDEARRGAWMYYGSPGSWHGHDDRLTIGFSAHGRDFLPEMGYPSHWDRKGEIFTRGMISHYIVLIDHNRCENRKSGFLDFFAAGSRARVARARAEAIYPGKAEVYRRTFAMIDSGDQSFLVDRFDVRGGQRHDYHFHGLPFGQMDTVGLDLISTQTTGTLLGEEVAWASDRSRRSTGYDLLRNVRRFQPSQEAWHIRWAGRDDCRLSYWMPAFPEILICDGEPPAKPDYPETMEFVIARNHAEESRFPAVISPSRGSEVVQSASFAQEGATTHYAVETEEGSWHIEIDDAGAFLAACTRTDGSHYGFCANRRDLTIAGKHLRADDGRAYTIEEVDYPTNTVHLAEPVREPGLLIGEVAIISGNGHSASYTVMEATRDMLRFEGPAITGRCIAETLDETHLRSGTRIQGYGAQLGAHELTGMVLVSAEKDMCRPILGHIAAEDTWTFEVREAFPEEGGDGQRLLYFADMAPGYAVKLAPWFEVEVAASGAMQIKGNVPVHLK